MKWVRDTSGRFAHRPHYEPEELDNECEQVVEAVLRERNGRIEYPISTQDLLFMLEREARLDQYADLNSDDGEIWGETEFLPGRQPRVRIWRGLSENERYENPFRTTITHEYGHVHFHGFLFATSSAEGSHPGPQVTKTWICKREHVEGHRNRDWMEWQAGYCSGALLMPKVAVESLVRPFRNVGSSGQVPVGEDTLEASQLVTAVGERFAVSRAAATVRLLQLGYLLRSSGDREKI